MSAHRILRERARRERLLPGMGEAEWLILCDLYAHRGRDISVTSACLASFAPATTALRHIGLLEQAGLIAREDSETDRRVHWLRLTERARDALTDFFAPTPPARSPDGCDCREGGPFLSALPAPVDAQIHEAAITAPADRRSLGKSPLVSQRIA